MADTATKPTRPMKGITLKKSGKSVVFPETYSTREFLAAQKAAGKDSSQVPVFLIQRLCTFDGESWTAGQIQDDLPGPDYIQLIGEIFKGDDEGND